MSSFSSNTYVQQISNRSDSIYADPSIPLSLYIHPCMVSNINHDDESNSSNRNLSLLDQNYEPSNINSEVGNNSKSLSFDWEAPLIEKKTGQILSKPIIFHNNIKSSGYGQIPNDLFARKKLLKKKQSVIRKSNIEQKDIMKTNDQTTVRQSANTNNNENTNINKGPHLRQYPLECNLIDTYQPLHDYPMKLTNKSNMTPTTAYNIQQSYPPISNIQYSDDGSLLALGTSDSAVTLVKLPVKKYSGEVITYLGHNSRITNINFSHSKYISSNNKPNKYEPIPLPQYHILSGSSDGTARLWRNTRFDQSAILFSHYKSSIDRVTAGVSDINKINIPINSTSSIVINNNKDNQRNKPYADTVNYSSFFYMDKFVLVNVKASMQMYHYCIESSKTKEECSDLNRTFSTCGSYRLVHQWDLAYKAQKICATTCVNSILSPLIFCATTEKIINILDASTGTIAREIQSTHTRNIHCICIPKPSIHVAISPDAYNLFLTSATDSSIKLWDLRTQSYITQYNTHINRSESITCDISPCLRYISTGSEDKSIRIYDIRTTKELICLHGYHKDIVSTVAFHPILPQLASGSYDGQVKFYSDPCLIM